MDIYDISASAMTAQRMRLDTIASNLANVNTTRQPDGALGPYRRKQVVFAPIMQEALNGFQNGEADGVKMLKGADGRPMLVGSISMSNGPGVGVEVVAIEEDAKTPLQRVYNPGHPDADKDGYVSMPNINVVQEMVDMMLATRAYEANVTAFQAGKAMNQAALEI